MSLMKFALAASLALMLTACGSNNDSTPTAPTTPTPTPPAGTGTTVTIANGATTAGAAAFGMNPLTVAVGTTVTWRNNDVTAHTATADAAGGFNTGNINTGASGTFTFTTAGTVQYHCAIHPGMTGTIVVQ